MLLPKIFSYFGIVDVGFEVCRYKTEVNYLTDQYMYVKSYSEHNVPVLGSLCVSRVFANAKVIDGSAKVLGV